MKRSADRLVRQGTDMPNAKFVFDQLRGLTSIKLFFVDTEQVDCANEQYKTIDLPTVPGTITLHQVLARSSFPCEITYKDVSCFCRKGIDKYICVFLSKHFHSSTV